MTQQATKDWSATFFDEDLRGLALILDYANEQARKLALLETTDLIARAARSLDGKLPAPPPNARDDTGADCDYERNSRITPEGEIRAWQAPEFLGGPIVLDDTP
jgi:hypothetical protein